MGEGAGIRLSKLHLILRATTPVGRGDDVLSKLLILRATAPVGGGDSVLSKLLLVLRVGGTHQKYSSV